MQHEPIWSIEGEGDLGSSDVPVNARVKINTSGKAEKAGAEEAWVGTALPADLNRGQISVQDRRVGLHFAIASEAISKGAAIYGAADGEIAASGTTVIGSALEAAAADQDVIRVKYL